MLRVRSALTHHQSNEAHTASKYICVRYLIINNRRLCCEPRRDKHASLLSPPLKPDLGRKTRFISRGLALEAVESVDLCEYFTKHDLSDSLERSLIGQVGVTADVFRDQRAVRSSHVRGAASDPLFIIGEHHSECALLKPATKSSFSLRVASALESFEATRENSPTTRIRVHAE